MIFLRFGLLSAGYSATEIQVSSGQFHLSLRYISGNLDMRLRLTVVCGHGGDPHPRLQ